MPFQIIRQKSSSFISLSMASIHQLERNETSHLNIARNTNHLACNLLDQEFMKHHRISQ
jgi:hypothetical protein